MIVCLSDIAYLKPFYAAENKKKEVSSRTAPYG